VNLEERILILTPTGRDSAMLHATLNRSGVATTICPTWGALERDYRVGAAAMLISEEALDAADAHRLHDLLLEQPAWSDLPVMLLVGRSGDTSAMHAAAQEIGNVTLLERPMRVAALLSAVEYALRARRRQYVGREQLLALERAADELTASERQLRETHARKDEFLATLAHELRNPLAPIRNAMHVLRRKSQDPSLTPLHDIIERQLRQMVRLVDDLLEVSRITRGKVALHLEHIDLASVLRGAIETSRPLIDAAQHRLEVELPPPGVHVHGDALRLGQVFSNLLNNAAKYTEDRGHIVLRARVRGAEVEVCVEDNGIGIDPAMISAVFDIFTQVAFSEGKGKGSRFTVHLPVASSPVAIAETFASSSSEPHRYSGRVIVVDDNRDAADTLAMVLRQHGAEVQTTYSAADALDILSPGAKVAVIADLGMPDLDGFELARRIRADDSNRHVRLIALSGWGQQEDRARAVAAGFDAHFTKPADIDALVASLTRIPERRILSAPGRTH
jgi:signal transduction histidine kinase/CheY-like chemotaxis protein